jgi:uncharacterized membrane protein (UPF0127 family)
MSSMTISKIRNERFRPALAIALLALSLSACSTKPASETANASGNSADNAAAAIAPGATIPLTIATGKTVHHFKVEVALTPEQQAQGLMFRKELNPDGGMVFPMSPPRTASFWMKNTVIPLDMLFIQPDGTVAMVAANTKPYSREPVSAGVPVSGVLELAGGRAAELGIGQGAVVHWGNCAAPKRPDEAWDQLNFCPASPAPRAAPSPAASPAPAG